MFIEILQQVSTLAAGRWTFLIVNYLLSGISFISVIMLQHYGLRHVSEDSIYASVSIPFFSRRFEKLIRGVDSCFGAVLVVRIVCVRCDGFPRVVQLCETEDFRKLGGGGEISTFDRCSERYESVYCSP